MTNTPTPPNTDTGAAGSPPGTEPADGRAGGRQSTNTSRNSWRNNNNTDWQNRGTRFTGNLASIETLSTKAERKGKENFSSFVKSLHQHVITTFTNPQDIAVAVTDFEDPSRKLNLTIPTLATVMNDLGYVLETAPAGETTVETAEREERNEEMKESANDLKKAEMRLFAERRKAVKSNLTGLWGVVLGQCTPSLKEEVRAMDGYDAKAAAYDSIWLLQTLQKVTAGVNNTSNSFYTLFHSLKDLYLIRQRDNESVDDYFRRFEAAMELVTLSKGKVVWSDSLEAEERKTNPTNSEDIVQQKFAAMAFIECADANRYKGLWKDLKNSLTLESDNYPKTLASAVHTLTHWKGEDTGGRPPRRGGERPNVQFHQRPSGEATPGEPVPGTNGILSAHIKCFKCDTLGHYSTVCPNPRVGTGYQGFQYVFAQTVEGNAEGALADVLNNNWILIDSGSTFNSFMNPGLLGTVTDCDEMRAYSNGGHLDYNKDATVQLLPALRAYHNTNSLANILALSSVTAHYRVVMDSQAEDALFVHVENDILRFEKCGHGLYFLDTTKTTPNNTNGTVIDYSFFSTVASNKEYFSRREIEGADTARLLQGRLGWPSTGQYKQLIENNLLVNTDVTTDDINRAEAIYGQAVPLIKGKMVRKRPEHTATVTRVQLPLPLVKHHPTDILDIDFLYVQGAPYLLSKTQKIKFQAIQVFNKVHNKKKKKTYYKRGKMDIINGVKKVISLYNKRGFKIDIINADNEFKKIEGEVGAHVEICAAMEHVPRIERSIRTFKERVRCCWVGLPYRKAPKLMVDENLVDMIGWLNAFPHAEGISNTLSPAAIVLGNPKPDCKQLRITFGAYCEVYVGTTNTQVQRSVAAIALRASNNRGGYYFMSLESGRRIHSFVWRELPIPDYVAKRVEELAESEDAPSLDEDGCPIFEWTPGTMIDDGVPNENQQQPVDDDEDDSIEDVTNDEYDSAEDEDYDPEDDVESVTSSDNSEEEIDNTLVDASSESGEDEGNNLLQQSEDEESEDDQDDLQDDPNAESNGEDEQELRSDERRDGQELRSDGRPSRSRQPPQSYEPSFGGKKYEVSMFNVEGKPNFRGRRELASMAVNVMFNQMTATKGIKMFGERAIAAMVKEYHQLHDMKVVGRIDPEGLTPEVKWKALRAINLIKEKRNGNIKGRTVADGSSHRKIVPREEASSPTVSLEALLATLTIDAHENRDVAIFDVPGAYLHADLPEGKLVLLKIEGQFVDIMCEVNPEFLPDVRYENGKKVLYVQILKALYGMIESALLWYSLYVDVLEKEGFEVNPYDKCVANKIIDGKQCTLAWYVDDNKLSHVDSRVVDDILETIEGYFPGLVIERGKKLGFLGMDIEFIGNGKVKIGMKKYIADTIEEFGEDVSKNVSSAAAKWLMSVNEDARKLNEERADKFHSMVAKLLWVMKRGRPDIETAVAFLCTRVKTPDVDDWCKLRRLMCFLHQTIDDERIIGADSLFEMITFVDAAHSVHPNMRGHTGGCVSFGTGIIDEKSSKQKMNTRSSTETEIVGTSEYLPKNIYFELFMEAQGYKLESNKLAQDNQSAMKMERNGKDSCSSNSKHIAIKYFWVTDRIKNGNIEVVYCPTTQMIADYFTKPLQGALFHTLRRVIMGWDHISTVFNQETSFKERVGNTEETENMVNAAPKTKKVKLTYKEAVMKQNGRVRKIAEEGNLEEI